MNDLRLKLIIDGQEGIATIKLTEAEYDKLYSKFKGFPGFPPTAITSMKALQTELLRTYQATEETVEATAEFIRMYGLSESQINEVIVALREEQKQLAIGSAQYRTHQAAITNLSTAYNNITKEQQQLTATSGKVVQGNNAMNMAMQQFGWVLGDANMFMVNFRMGLMSIGNNIPMVVMYFQQASKEAQTLGITIGQSLVRSLSGAGGLLLAVNAVMLVMQLLPAIFQDTTTEVKKQKEEIEKLTNEYDKLTKRQLEIKKATAETELSKLTSEFQAKYGDSNKLLKVFEGIGIGIGGIPWPFAGMLKGMAEMSNEEKKRYEQLLNEVTAIDKVSSKLGYVKNLENELNLLLEKRKEIKDKDAITAFDSQILHYKRLIENANKGIEDNSQKSISSLANEKKEAEILAGKLKEIEILKNTSISQYEKEKQVLKENYEAKIKSIDAEINALSGKRNPLPADLQKIKNLETGKQVEKGEYERADLELKKKHDLDLLEAEEQYIEKKMALEKKSEVAILEQRKSFLNVLWALETDPEKKAEIERNQALIDSEITKRKVETGRDIQKILDDSIHDEFDRKRSQARLEYELEKEKYGDLESLRKAYQERISDIDREEFLYKLSLANQMVQTITDAYGQLYSNIESGIRKEIDDWGNKEEKKLAEERKAALSHARTQAQKDRINEQYDRKEQQLEDEKQKRAEERLAGWFALQKAVSIAQATIATYRAADEQLATPPVGPWNIALAAAIIAAGLANVAVIASQEMPQGFAEGGRLSKGKAGFVEGWHNEIIAPEQTFETIMRNELIPRVINNIGSDPALLDEIKLLRSEMKNIKVAIGDNECKRIASKGIGVMKGGKL